MPVCITGMHRSGTSMVAKMLHLGGVFLGPEADLLQANKWNPDGFFENIKLLALNDAILDELGAGWDFPPRSIPDDWQHRDSLIGLKMKAESILHDFQSHELWGFKDPRTCLTLPFWKELLPDGKVIVCVRNPLEVVLSLRRRNYFSLSHSLQLWEAYNQSVLRYTTPDQRLVTHHDAYFYDAGTEIPRVLKFLGISVSDELIDNCRKAVTERHRHWRLTAQDLVDADVPAEVTRLYAQLCDEAQWVDSSELGGTRIEKGGTSLLRTPSGDATTATGNDVTSRSAHRLSQIWEAQQMRQTLSDRNAELEQLRKAGKDQNANLLSAQQDLSHRDHQLGEMRAKLDAERAAAAEVRAQTDAKLQYMVARLESLASQQAATNDSVKKLTQSVESLQKKLEETTLAQRQTSETISWMVRLWSASASSGQAAQSRSTDGCAEQDRSVESSVCFDYPRLVSMIQETVPRYVPAGAIVIVVSKGDDDLVRLGNCIGWHFPQLPDGTYAGYHPPNGAAALQELETLRTKGGQFLVLPNTAFWWLDHYPEFHQHLRDQYRRIFADDACIIYDVNVSGRASAKMSQTELIREAAPTFSPRSADLLRQDRPTIAPTPRTASLPKPGGSLRIAMEYPETLPLLPRPGTFDPKHMDLQWILPDIEQGMGGPMAIFRFIQCLEEFGHKNTIWIRGGTRHGDGDRARQFICKHFVPINATVGILKGGDLDQVRGDAVIATHCWTAYPVRAIQNVRERFYFVQDFEPSFYPMGSEYLLAEATYRFGFSCITSSNWLQQMMRDRFDVEAARFTYAYDAAVYNTNGPERRASNRVAFYARTKTARRSVEIGLMALENLASRVPSLLVDFFGGSVGKFNAPYQYVDHGVLDDRQLAALYRTATVGVVLSSTNYSLIPHEMMACGLPVIELDGESTRADFPANTVSFAPPDPTGLASKIELLLADASHRQNQARQALDHVRRLSWNESARQIESALIRGISRSRAKTPADVPQIQVKKPKPDGEVGDAPNRHGDFSRFGPIVFVGQPEYYRSVYFDLTSTGDHFEYPISYANRSGLMELPSFVRDRQIKTCVVFRPEWFAAYPESFRALKALDVTLIGYSSEPVPTKSTGSHPDQLSRLKELTKALSLEYDLMVHYDAASLEFLKEIGFQRIMAHPLPVSRKLFYPEDVSRDFDACFLGKSTAYREQMLAPLKARFSVVHVAHGLRDEEARQLMNRSRLVLNIHNENYVNFENRVVQALFCQRPVLSESLSGDLLIPDRDFIPFDSPQDLCRKVAAMLSNQNGTRAKPQADLDSFTIEAFLQRLAEMDWVNARITAPTPAGSTGR